jgi:DNA mismatch repair protein MutS2
MTDRGPAEERPGVLATVVVSTPSAFPASATTAVLAELEFTTALETVARYAVSELGAASVRRRVPQRYLEWIEAELATVAELQRLLDSGDPFRPEAVQDLTSVVEKLAVPGNVLEPEELNAVGSAIEGMRTVRGSLLRIAPDAPRVAAFAVEVPPAEIAAAIARSLDPDGRVKDEASPELAKARRRVRETRSRLVAFLEQQLRRYGQEVSGAEVTVRGGRYVIPVRRDDRNRVRGIVHEESSSGATLFVEPPEAVELGNELNAWEAQEARAVLAVLRELTGRLRPHGGELARGLLMCERVDDTYARARYAVEMDGTTPTMVEPPSELKVSRGVHPLLRAESSQPVPFELQLADNERTLLVSGPNAGGKTVLLKAMGLLSAFAQSGIIPPVGPGTVLPVFHHFFVDIGDHQSIAASLSTFSAHVAEIKQVLVTADSRSLVLLDEVGGGTDPVEGAALAGATLLSLNDRGSTTIATTHLSDLKDLAARTAGIVNGSLQFDMETLAPTYRFVKDQPGRSFGLAIARRLGLPVEVLERAEALLPEQARSLDAILADLERKEVELSGQAEELAAEAARLERLRRDNTVFSESLEGREQRLREQERQLERDGREQARQFLLQARRRVEEALGLARTAATEKAAKEARRLVEAGVKEEGEALKQLEQLAKKGWRVTASGEQLARSGGIRAEHRAKGKIQEVPPSTSDTGPVSSPPERSRPMMRQPEVPAATSDIDIRGMTGDEAEAAVILALDYAVADDLPWLRIIHGKGTGVLRARVGEVLQRDGRVKRFTLAPAEQGGSGVTVVEFIS